MRREGNQRQVKVTSYVINECQKSGMSIAAWTAAVNYFLITSSNNDAIIHLLERKSQKSSNVIRALQKL